ncbi:uncharacterized protein [Miscanthus floridulus]|uniref:uncharacterized protein n=1 Tax=Miscanthus floridulus TaxID=154761 RepID=UPI003457CE67
MDELFTYVGAGSAVSSHDISVLTYYMGRPDYPHPPAGRYYLVDFGYAVRAGYLGPYRNTRYHLDDFRGREAEGYMEKFNYQHSRLHNVVEQSFGKLKARWYILEGVPNYVRYKLVKVLFDCCISAGAESCLQLIGWADQQKLQ